MSLHPCFSEVQSPVLARISLSLHSEPPGPYQKSPHLLVILAPSFYILFKVAGPSLQVTSPDLQENSAAWALVPRACLVPRLMGEARPGLRGQTAAASLGPSILLILFPAQAGALGSSPGQWGVHVCCEVLSHPKLGCNYAAPSSTWLFAQCSPHPAPGPHRQEDSPDLQVQDHASPVVLVRVCLDPADPGALEEMPEG